jgi:hypothetical protein
MCGFIDSHRYDGTSSRWRAISPCWSVAAITLEVRFFFSEFLLWANRRIHVSHVSHVWLAVRSRPVN